MNVNVDVDVEVNVDEGVVAHSVDRPSGKLVAGTHRHTHRSTLTHTHSWWLLLVGQKASCC